jgi:hypothetical protein
MAVSPTQAEICVCVPAPPKQCLQSFTHGDNRVISFPAHPTVL